MDQFNIIPIFAFFLIRDSTTWFKMNLKEKTKIVKKLLKREIKET